jgi:hypothetical protein
MGNHVKGLLKGGKFNGKHSTVISDAVAAIEAAKSCQYVSKIALGIINQVRPSQPHLKFTFVSGGLKMQIRGINAVQIIWVYTTEPDKVIVEITEKWNLLQK